MNILFIGSNILDADEIVSATEQPGHLQLTFKNGDKMALGWRDEHEKSDILKAVPPTLKGAESNLSA